MRWFLNNYATPETLGWILLYKTGTGNIETIYMFASGENDSNLVKNAGAGKIDYAWSKSTDDAKAIESMDGMKVFQLPISDTPGASTSISSLMNQILGRMIDCGGPAI